MVSCCRGLYTRKSSGRVRRRVGEHPTTRHLRTRDRHSRASHGAGAAILERDADRWKDQPLTPSTEFTEPAVITRENGSRVGKFKLLFEFEFSDDFGEA